MAESRFTKAFQKLTGFDFPTGNSGWNLFSVPGSNFNYAKEVGDGSGSSTIMAPIEWIGRTFPAAPIQVYKVLSDGNEELDVNHDMTRLLHRPNPHYSGRSLWEATIFDYYLSGNAYWLILRDRGGRPAQLWWIPSQLIEPRKPDNGDKSVFIDYYKYMPDGQELRVDPSNIVHFRYGIDSVDQMIGRSPLTSVLREVYTDDQAANYTASLLKNMGVPGLVVSPKEGSTSVDGKSMKESVGNSFKGDNKGEPLVFSAPTEIEQFGWSPEQLNLKDLRRVPEERVTAVLGIPAIVAGLGAGLDRSTFANFAEAREAAYESNIIPTQESMSEDIKWQLLPNFEKDPMAWKVAFDLTDVRILQEDENKKAERYNIGVAGGWIKRSEARREFGLEVEDTDEVYLLSASLEEVVPGEEKEEPAPVMPFPPTPPTEENEEAEPPAPAEQVEEEAQNEPED